NERYKYLLGKGASGLYCFGDTITHQGIDPDHPLAEGYAGVSGVSIVCLQDMYDLFEGISLEDVSVSFNNPSMAATVVYSAFVAYAEDMGYDLKKISGSILNEPIHLVYSMYETNAKPLDLGAKLATDVIEYSIKNTPRWHPIAPNAYDMHEKGANAIQEMAFTIAIMEEYIQRMIKRGYDIDEFAPRVNVFGCACDIDFFEEICKFRAARRVWAKLMKEKYGAKKPASCRLYLSVHTSGNSLTVQQPVNNVARVTLESLACVLGGLQSFDPAGYDEGYYILTEHSALTSLNIHNILAYESRVASVADPLAGSYFIESLTSKMEEEMFKIINKIDEMGGAIKATESGWIGAEMEHELINEQKEIEDKKRIIVGLNEFIVSKDEEVPIMVGRDRPLEEQMATSKERENQIKKLREMRDQDKTKTALESLREEAGKGNGSNLVPFMKESLRAEATLGEILGVIREAYGASYDPYEVLQYPF
ncbi:MAG: acyl-CoA mutase large subunit family protein, partial [Thermodesulfobacteriota bacterium]|nr:acyl-CoA mutase large subunit family protein [Thermodesulfobacteriota bacterium]